MAELEKKLTAYFLNHSEDDAPKSIGQVFKHFGALGYNEQEISDALRAFSKKHIAQTTNECN